jgi:hypothetical protein
MNFLSYRIPAALSAATFGALIGLSTLPAQAESDIKLSTGYDYSSGKYGQQVTTEIETLLITMNYLRGPWSLNLTVPTIRVTGNGTVIPGANGPSSFENFSSGFFGTGSTGNASTSQTVTHSGLGDASASVGYAYFPANGNFYEITAKVKFATADVDKGLGTGENDYTLQFDAVFNSGAVSPYFSLGYAITGDSSLYTYKNVPYGTLGLIFKTGAASSFGVGYDYRQATVDGSDDLQQASVFFNWSGSRQWATTLSALTGFTDSSPDFGVSLMFTRSY